MSKNIDTVKQIYESFGRQDIPAILSKLADDVEWEYGNAPCVPWLQERKNREDVTGYFEALEALDFASFVPKMFFENENIVIVLLDAQWTYKDTGKFVDNQDAVHIWHFNPEGKIVKYGHRVDSYSHWLATQKE